MNQTYLNLTATQTVGGGALVVSFAWRRRP